MKRRPCLALAAVVVLSALAPFASQAELKLHPLFTDHAVLQRDMEVPVWGWADPDAEVKVSFAGQTVSGKADADGAWMVKLQPLTTNAEGSKLTVTSGDASVACADVLVGEVWIGSGQSNMGWSVSRTDDVELVAEEAKAGKFDGMRLFKVPIAGEDKPQDTVKAAWALPEGGTIHGFSATAFYFGRALQRELQIPIGLIQTANGGTNAYSWINNDTYQNDPVAAPTREYFAAVLKAYPAAKEKYEKALEDYKAKAKAAKEAGKPFDVRAPREPLHAGHVKRPTGHYNAMVAPLEPVAFRGVIWYQGEANSRPPFADQYKDLMFALIEDWRTDWAAAAGTEVKAFPFYVVQLPNYAGGDAWGWPVIREQMLQIWQEGENTGTVVTIDTGDANDIHPTNKTPVGERLARFALGDVYEKPGVFSGPIFKSMRVEGGKAVVEFDHVGKGLTTSDGEPLKYFTIAGDNGEFVPAEAKIDGDKVIVSNSEVAEPKAVRYAWSNNPEGANFGNKDGLMASPFRSDTGPIPNP